MSMDIEFRMCPHCAGYGVRDSGKNCTTCGGIGSGGLTTLGTPGNIIGSGELLFDRKTGRQISLKELCAYRAPQQETHEGRGIAPWPDDGKNHQLAPANLSASTMARRNPSSPS